MLDRYGRCSICGRRPDEECVERTHDVWQRLEAEISMIGKISAARARRGIGLTDRDPWERPRDSLGRYVPARENEPALMGAKEST